MIDQGDDPDTERVMLWLIAFIFVVGSFAVTYLACHFALKAMGII